MGKGKILIMDEESIVSLANVQGLKNLQYEAEATRDGFTAIETYKRAAESGKSFDVVVLDLIISHSMGGEEAIKKLLEIDPDVKAIVTSTSIQ